MATDYLDSLSDDDVGAVESALTNHDTVTSGTGPDADALSQIVDGAPALGQEVTLYRYYDDSKFEIGTPLYSFTEPGFLVGSTMKPTDKAGAVIFAFKIPAGMQGVQLSDDLYLLDRGLTIFFTPDLSGVFPATVGEAFQNGKALTAGARVQAPMIRFNGGMIPPQELRGQGPVTQESIEEFYNHAHGPGGRFTSGGSSGGGGGSLKAERPGGQGNQQHGNRGQQQGNRGGHQQGNRGQGGGGGGHGNQGQHQRHGQGNRAFTPPGQHGNRPQQGHRPPPKQETKAEKHLQRTANIIRGVTAIIGVVAVVAGAVRGFNDIKQHKANVADRENQRYNNAARAEETRRKTTPDFGNNKEGREAKGVFDYLNPKGTYIAPNPQRRAGIQTTNIA